jgi:hypothetical protein
LVHDQRPPSFRHQKTSRLPTRPLSTTVSPSQETGAGKLESLPAPARHQAGEPPYPSPLSFPFRLSTTCCPRTRHHCPAADSAGVPSRSTCGTLPDSSLLNTRVNFAGTEHHPGRSSPSPVSCSLRAFGHVARSFSAPCRPVCPRVPPWHSFQGTQAFPDFWGPKLEAPPYPSEWTLRGLAPSPNALTGKRSMRLSWLSFSPPEFLFLGTPSVVSRSVLPVARSELPTPANVARTLRAFHPIGLVRLWSSPRCGISSLRSITLLATTASLSRGLSRSPCSENFYGIELRDYS